MLRVVRGAVIPGLCLIGVFKDALLEGDEFRVTIPLSVSVSLSAARLCN